jgi:hypothetical protein
MLPPSRFVGGWTAAGPSLPGSVRECGSCEVFFVVANSWPPRSCVWGCVWVAVQGTLVFIAASDILPSLLENEKKRSPGVVLRHLLLMAVGVVALGLTKLHHEHCEAGAHAHAAHDH